MVINLVSLTFLTDFLKEVLKVKEREARPSEFKFTERK